MSDERLVMALLEEGNPATEVGDDAWTEMNAATYLATLEQRNIEMTQLETKATEKKSPRPSTKGWLVAAIAVIVLGVAAVVVSQDGVPAIPLAGAEGDAQATEEFRAVETAFHAFNTGDPAWVEVRDRGNVDPTSEEDLASGIVALQAAHDANARIEVSGCESRGHGSWGSVVDRGAPIPTGYYFICETTETGTVWDTAGIELATTYHWVVDNGEVVAVRSTEDPSEVFDFDEAFQAWFDEAHPEVAADLPTLLNDPETVPAVLEYAEEFVAQSDIYPIETSGS